MHESADRHGDAFAHDYVTAYLATGCDDFDERVVDRLVTGYDPGVNPILDFAERNQGRISSVTCIADNQRLTLHLDIRQCRRGGEITMLASAFESLQTRVTEQFDQLESNDRLRRELISNLSHDLQTPLASIQGYVERCVIRMRDNFSSFIIVGRGGTPPAPDEFLPSF